MEKRQDLRIELTGPAKQKLDKLSDYHGMTLTAVMSRLVDFLLNQDQDVRSAIVTYYPGDTKGQREVVKKILKSLT